MRGPYGFETSENCQTCKLRENGFFCQLSAPALKEFNDVEVLGNLSGGRSAVH